MKDIQAIAIYKTWWQKEKVGREDSLVFGVGSWISSERALEEEQLELVWSRCGKSVRFVSNGLIGVPLIFTRESSGRQSRVLLDCARMT